jgi:hypothetical protein
MFMRVEVQAPGFSQFTYLYGTESQRVFISTVVGVTVKSEQICIYAHDI